MVLCALKDLLKSHGLLESDFSTSTDGDRGQRRERLTERKKLHQLKRDHEQQETTKRKVLKLDEGQDDFSSGSDTEKTGRGRKDKQAPGPSVDIQVNLQYNVQSKTLLLFFFNMKLKYLSFLLPSNQRRCLHVHKMLSCMFEALTCRVTYLLDSSPLNRR